MHQSFVGPQTATTALPPQMALNSPLTGLALPRL